MRRKSLSYSYVLLCLLSWTWPSATTAGISEWVDIDIVNGHIVIPISIEGIPAVAMLDTGANSYSISHRFVTKNNLSLGQSGAANVSGIVEARRVNAFNNVPIKIFGVELELDRVHAGNLGGYDMVLGVNFITPFIIQIDYPGKRLRLIEHDSLDLRKTANVKMKKERLSGLPIVRVNLNDDKKKAWMILDTGNAFGLLMGTDIPEKYNWQEKYGVGQHKAYGAHNVVSVFDTMSLPKLEIGPFALPNVMTSMPARGQPSELIRNFDLMVSYSSHVKSRISRKGTVPVGLLGYDILRHFIVTIDYKNSKIHLAMPKVTKTATDYQEFVGQSVGDLIRTQGKPLQTTLMPDNTKSYYWEIKEAGFTAKERDSSNRRGILVCELFATADVYGTVTEVSQEGDGC